MKKVLILICIFVFNACSSDYLIKEPIDRPSVSSFLTNEIELELAINGAYEILWHSIEYNIPNEIHLDLASDIGWSRAFTDFQFLGNGSVDPSNPVILKLWRQYFNGIQRANYILNSANKIDEISDPNRFDQILAEARFLRAYFFYHLTEMFGNVPLVLDVMSLDESYIRRNNKNEIVDFMLNELDDVAAVLPVEYTQDKDLGRITKGIALGLKSRIALFNERFEDVVDASIHVMTLEYQLDEEYSALYVKDGQKNSNEIMWLLDYRQGVKTHSAPQWLGSRMGNGYAGLIPTQSMIDSYLCSDGLTIDKSPLYDPLDPYENRDPRLHFSVVVPGSVFHGYQYETHKDSVRCWNYNVSPPVRVDNQDVLNSFASFSGYCWRKYSDRRNPNYLTQSETGFILMRYAEILLNFIEAKIELGQIDESIYDAFNLLRDRAGMPLIEKGLSQDQLRSALRIERKMELAFEGFRLYDIRRWKIAERVLKGPLYGRISDGLLNGTPIIDEFGTPDYSKVSNKVNMRIIEQRQFDPARNYLWPIPQFELDINSQMDQNSGY